jgi:hypothetical protein
MTRPYTIVVVGTALAAAGVFAITAISPDRLRTSNTMRVSDFGAYWTATKVALNGGNPYDEASLLPSQQEIEPSRTYPGAAWSPPWVFPVHAPFVPMDFSAARWTWRFFQIGTLFAAATALWRVYGGPSGKVIWAWSAALMWYPTLQLLGLGQHSNLPLLGVAGWLACQTTGRPFAAGAFLALVLVKPQNLYLLGLVGIIWTINQHAWRVAAGAIIGTAVFTGAALWVNPALFQDYLEAFRDRPPANALPPTIGMHLRMIFGEDRFWLVFLPPLAGMAWGMWYYLRNRAAWDWAERAPVIILVSCITSPYGWMYDQVLLLIPVIAILARAANRPSGILPVMAVVVGITTLCLMLHSAGMREVTFVWHAPLCLILYLVASEYLRRTHSFSNNS